MRNFNSSDPSNLILIDINARLTIVPLKAFSDKI